METNLIPLRELWGQRAETTDLIIILQIQMTAAKISFCCALQDHPEHPQGLMVPPF